MVSLAEGFGAGFRWVAGPGFPVENVGKVEGSGECGGWGGDRPRDQQVNAHAFVKATL